MLSSAISYDTKMSNVTPGSGKSAAARFGFSKSPLLGLLLEMRSAWWNVFLFSFVLNALMLAPSLFSMQVYDRVLASRNEVTLIMLSLVALAAFAATSGLEWARSRIMVRIGLRFDHELGARLLKISHRINLEKSGTVGTRLLNDLFTVRSFMSGSGAIAALDVPWVPIFLVAMFLLHPSLAITTVAGSLVLVGLAFLTERSTDGPLQRANEKGAEAMRFACVNLRNGEVIEAMGMFDAMSGRWQERQNGQLFEQAFASDKAGWTTAISKFVRVTNQNVALVVSAYLSLSGQVSMGVMFAAAILAGRMTAPIEQLIMTWSQWGNAKDAWRRIDDALALRVEDQKGVSLPPPTGELELEGLSGGPPSMKTPFLKNISLKVPVGASVAIIGASASGKSTLLRLITGVWRPISGTVRLDGADIHHWERGELGPYIGYLPQDVELIEGTIAENIARHQDIDSEKVIAAATAAGVHEMVLQMPDGYDTEVGNSGTHLSGGQRQRVGLARALYGDPKLLILDEPNANLDETGEAALDRALQAAKTKGQTVLLVSHRPTAIRNCDLMMVMQNGQVTLYGPRDQVFGVLSKAVASAAKPTAEVGRQADQARIASTAPPLVEKKEPSNATT
jgi:ATP-binding cassette subfamily C exporter for protease/lipase